MSKVPGLKRGLSGTVVHSAHVGGERVRAFVTKPLPPMPTLVVDLAQREEIDHALLALGRLGVQEFAALR